MIREKTCNARTATGELGSLASRRSMDREWVELCSRYLPITAQDSIWRFSRPVSPQDPTQGWKLHISSTVLTISKVLRKIAPYLSSRGELYKAPRSLTEVANLNCGLFYGYSQIGKCITIYPKNAEEAHVLARRLDKVTRRIPSPCVPFDVPYRRGGSVFYRYGAFNSLTLEQPDGTHVPAIRAPDGTLVPDRRAVGTAAPSWVINPFLLPQVPRAAKTDSLLGTSIFAYKAISQRGKGGVYKAIDTSTRGARLCILKEGRRHGETGWDGRDGRWRVRHEQQVLEALARSGIGVPKVYASFSAQGNYYVVMELIEGSDLEQIITDAPSPLPFNRAIQYGVQLAELLNNIHQAGWVWRDCKPSNLMLTDDGVMRPLDFEGAHLMDHPDPEPWGTLGYIPPEVSAGPRAAHDLYALGAILHQLLTGEVPKRNLEKQRRQHLPPAIDSLISSLLDSRPEARPDARTVSEILRAQAGH